MLNSYKNIKTPIPPFQEQLQIVEEIESRLSVCDHVKKTIEATMKSKEALRQSILIRAVEGIVVEQDPNEEPASELLKRIKENEWGMQQKLV